MSLSVTVALRHRIRSILHRAGNTITGHSYSAFETDVMENRLIVRLAVPCAVKLFLGFPIVMGAVL
jgi:hypothetical protein